MLAESNVLRGVFIRNLGFHPWVLSNFAVQQWRLSVVLVLDSIAYRNRCFVLLATR